MIDQREFDQEVKYLAAMIIEEYNIHDTDPHDACHEVIDGHAWVIYYSNAKAVCCNVDTDDGMEWVEDIGGFEVGHSEPLDFDTICTKLAYATLFVAVQSELTTLLEEIEGVE